MLAWEMESSSRGNRERVRLIPCNRAELVEALYERNHAVVGVAAEEHLATRNTGEPLHVPQRGMTR